ncbi:metallophosphoesterase [Candidatus Poribacteria bacterium]|nr:metallophosphoesterase [Candidatus Poribacteria bacterium]
MAVLEAGAPTGEVLPVTGETSCRVFVALLAASILAPACFAFAQAYFVLARRANFFGAVRETYFALTVAAPAMLALTGVYGLVLRRSGLRSPLLLRVSAACVVLAACTFGVRVYATHIEPRRLQVRTVRLESNRIHHPVRLLHISDLQSGKLGAYEERVFKVMRDLEPDLVISTGDWLQPIPPTRLVGQVEKLDSLGGTFEPPLGKYTVTGDVDWGIRERLSKGIGGFHALIDDSIVIESGEDRIRLIGLDLGKSRPHSQALATIQGLLPPEGSGEFVILAGHSPDFVLKAKDLPVDLCLAGHTHGGQIRVPFFGPIVTFTTLPRAWARGFRKVGRTWLNVSAGIGAEHAEGLPSIRVNCPPEVTLIELVPEDGATAQVKPVGGQ